MAKYHVYTGEESSFIMLKIIERCKELYGVQARIITVGKIREVELVTLLPLTPDEKRVIREAVPFGIIIREV